MVYPTLDAQRQVNLAAASGSVLPAARDIGMEPEFMRVLMVTSFPIPGEYDGTAMLPIKIMRRSSRAE